MNESSVPFVKQKEPQNLKKQHTGYPKAVTSHHMQASRRSVLHGRVADLP